MKILFLTLVDVKSIDEKNIYMDLLNEFVSRGDEVTLVSPLEKKFGKESYVLEKPGMKIIKAKTGNLFNVGMIEKGISQVMLSRDYAKAIKKFAENTNFSEACTRVNDINSNEAGMSANDTKKAGFDLIIYSTPPITLTSVVAKQKKKNNATTYLLLKDIFPQNAIDIGLLPAPGAGGVKNIIKGMVTKHFRRQEKKLYMLSDKIGCMSPANVKYLLDHNPEIPKDKVEVCPNSIAIEDMSVDQATRVTMREKYNLPQDKIIFVYGGNLGKPQDIPFVIECLRASKDIDRAHFLIVGDGTEYHLLEEYLGTLSQERNTNGEDSKKKFAGDVDSSVNFSLFKRLDKTDYDKLVAACDVGLIFLDYRFTIPNFPSRLLSYMQAKLPVLAVTDEASDVGGIAEAAGFGWKVPSNDAVRFADKAREICDQMSSGIENNSKPGTDGKGNNGLYLEVAGEKSWQYLNDNYDVKRGCDIIYEAVK